MGDPNPNHFLVHSALVLPPLVVHRSSCEAPKSGSPRNQRNHRSIDLTILGWLEKNVEAPTVPAVVDVVPVLGRFLEWLFLTKLYETRKRDTHTHWIQCFQQLEPFAWTPGIPKKINPPKKPTTCEKRNTLPNAKKHALTLRQLISHCPDLLELPTLCGSSITGMASSASQIASWGSQVAIACGEGALEREMVVTWETHLPVNAEVNVFGRG